PELAPPSPQHHDRGPAHAYLPLRRSSACRARTAPAKGASRRRTSVLPPPGRPAPGRGGPVRSPGGGVPWRAMESAPPPGTAAALLAILGDGAAGPERQLRTLVTAIDLAVAREPEHGLAAQALARAVAAVGRPLLARHPDGPQTPRISATLAAAEAYARDPDDRTERALYQCATDSYPFGPGEGHYGTTERDGCEPGSGCRSGAGTLLFAARETGFAAAIQALTAELAPWLRS